MLLWSVTESSGGKACRCDGKSSGHRVLLSTSCRYTRRLLELELNEAFAQYKGKLKEVVQGHGVWLSERALVIAIVTIEALIFLVGFLVYHFAKAKFT